MQAFSDIISQTFRILWAHKLRSFLTMFGIAWGVGSLLLLVGLGEGFRSGQAKNLSNLGTDIMFLFSGRVPAIEGSSQSGKLYRLTYDDYVAIKNEARSVRNVSPVLNREDIRAVSDYNTTNGQVFGVSYEYNQIRTIPLQTGRWLTTQDQGESRRVAVIASELVKTMYSGRPAVGTTILLNGIRFDVVGVLEKVGREGNNGTNIRVFIPITTMRELFPLKDAGAEDAVSFINYRPLRADLHEQAKREVHQIIARRHGFDPNVKDAFEEWDTVEEAKRVGLIFSAMDYFLGAVGLVTLGLGAIGIINIMLVSVTERTREIGLRKALGATNRNILTQFFVEGAFLTAFSGGIGLTITWLFVTALAQLPAPEGFDTPRIVPLSAVAAIGSLCIAGIVAGLYPARKAAMLQPVDALRQE
jgi:putative ABC transport system permease protein